MRDIQSQADDRGLEIDEVGIAGLQMPVAWNDGTQAFAGIADISCSVRLPASRRGTHMSRMVEIALEHLEEFDPREMPQALKSGAAHLDVESLRLRLAMPFATKVAAPSTGRESWQVHRMSMAGAIDASGIHTAVTVTSDVTSLCPCSKAISDYGAHNQRSEVSVTIEGAADLPYPMAVTDVVTLIRGSGSCAVYPLIKRPDERVVTMRAYDNALFVEDMARDLSVTFRGLQLRHSVAIRNIESIHSHDAIARISG